MSVSRLENSLPILRNLVTQALGTVIAQNVGGDAGELIGPAVGTVLDHVARFDAGSARQAEKLVEDASRRAGVSVEDVAHWLQSDEHLRLFVGVVEASWRTRDRDKLGALSQVLADGVTDDARIDITQLLAEAFREIEAPHLRLLEHMALHAPPPQYKGWEEVPLGKVFPKLQVGLPSLIATLQRTGCVTSTNAFLGAANPLVVSPFGHELLKYVRQGGVRRDARGTE
jgi:hypothetical protein